MNPAQEENHDSRNCAASTEPHRTSRRCAPRHCCALEEDTCPKNKARIGPNAPRNAPPPMSPSSGARSSDHRWPDRLYPNATCALTHRNAWELLVATILSAQCTDVRVNLVTPMLFEKYPTVQDFAALEPEQLEPDIRSTGFFATNRSRGRRGAQVVADFGGQVPQTMDELLTLPGVARKTANVVLGTWFKKNEGVVVDTHVTRISRRLELTQQEDAKKMKKI